MKHRWIVLLLIITYLLAIFILVPGSEKSILAQAGTLTPVPTIDDVRSLDETTDNGITEENIIKVQQLQEPLYIPSDGTIVQASISSGEHYLITISGTYVWGKCDPGVCPGGGPDYLRYGDANYLTDDQWESVYTNFNPDCCFLEINGSRVGITEYRSDHVYQLPFTSTSDIVSIRISDCNCWGDNQGGLTVEFEHSTLPDYTIDHIEVTQAIQDLENSVPLIAGKKTYARIHVRNNGAPSNQPVTAKLCRDGNECISPNNLNGLIPIKNDPARGELNDSFYFLLPENWVGSPGALTLTATVNLSGELRVPESILSNNSFTGVTTQILPSYPLKIRLFNVIYWQWAPLPHIFGIPETRPDLQYITSWLKRAYPVDDKDVDVRLDSLYLDTSPLDATTATLRISLRLFEKKQLDFLTGDKFSKESIYYGAVIDGDYSSSGPKGAFVRGVGGYDKDVALGPTGTPGVFNGINDPAFMWDTDGHYGDWYAGHEIGHILIDFDNGGKDHIASSDYGCGVATGPNPNFPYLNGRIGGWADQDPERFYGFDTDYPANSERVKVYPYHWHDMMAYCPNLWISDYHYLEIHESLQERAQTYDSSIQENRASPDGATSTEYLLVTGIVNATQDTAEFESSYRLHSDVVTGPSTGNEYTLVFLDSADNFLATYPVEVEIAGDSDPGEDVYGLLTATVPWVNDTKQIALQHNGQTLATQNVSTATPQVTVEQPNGSEVVVDTLEISWSASDADNDPLSYTVQYSADSGQSWDTLSIGITNTLSIEVDASQLPGSDNALVRVLASDGVNTGIDQSDQTFRLAGKVPEAVINSPTNGETYFVGQTIGLFGEAYDVEDGYLKDSAITWASDRSGLLGTGTSVYPDNLALGTHQIIITATDSDGNQSTDIITITIEQAPEPPEAPSQPNPQDGAVNVSVNVALSWVGSDPNPGDNLIYNVSFGTDNPPPLVSTGQSMATYDPPGDMISSTIYYWQITATDDLGFVTEGPVWSFTTAAPNIAPDSPSDPSPVNASTDVAVTTGLSWSATDPDNDPLTYEVRFGTTNPPPQVVAGQSATTYDPPGDLDYSTTYYWQIVANDGRGGETSGPVWSFTTAEPPNQPPNAPATPNPAHNATNIAITAALSWSATDPDNDPLTYEVRFGTTNPPPQVVAGQSATTYDPPGDLDYSTTYYWQIVANDGRGGETSGPVWSFTTVDVPIPFPNTFYISPSNNKKIAGIAAASADILRYEKSTNTWTMIYDGSVRGTTKNVSAFDIMDDGSLLLVFSANQKMTIEDNPKAIATPYDVVKFIPNDPNTFPLGGGIYEWYFRGKTHDLSTGAEKIDAIDKAGNRLLLSTTGTAKITVSGASITVTKEDVFAYNTTTDQWESTPVIDGSIIPELKGKNISSVWDDPNSDDYYVTVAGAFKIGGVKGNAQSIVKLTPNGSSFTPSFVDWLAPGQKFPSNLDGLDIAP